MEITYNFTIDEKRGHTINYTFLQYYVRTGKLLIFEVYVDLETNRHKVTTHCTFKRFHNISKHLSNQQEAFDFIDKMTDLFNQYLEITK